MKRNTGMKVEKDKFNGQRIEENMTKKESIKIRKGKISGQVR